MNAPTAPPRWSLLLPVLVLAAFWPLDPYWQSDDFLALHHVQDWRRALADFLGPQFGAPDLWWFHRPLVTLSFWFDLQIGGTDPFWSHLFNALLHAGSAMLVFLLWRRLLGELGGSLACLLWALSPSHAGAVLWAAGRSDLLAGAFGLLSLLGLCRHLEGQRPGLGLSLPALLAALLSKEVAFALPPLLTLLVWSASPTGSRLRRAVAFSWPHWLLFAGYLAWRWLALGRIAGGYTGSSYEPLAMASGLWTIALDLLAPLRWSGTGLLGSAAPFVGLAAVPAAVALLMLLSRWPHVVLLLGLAFLLASAPMAAFLGTPESVHNLRYFYLAHAVLAGAVTGGSRIAAAVLLLLLLPSLQAIRAAYVAADRESAEIHRALLLAAEPGKLLFVAGLPHANRDGTAVQFHFGVDRLTEPPFGPGGCRLLPLRPAAEGPGIHRLWPEGTNPFPLPGGETLRLVPPSGLHTVPAQPSAELPLSAPDRFELSAARLGELARGELGLRIESTGVRPQAFRVTIFTAVGYLCVLVPDHAEPGALDGAIDLYRLFRDGRFGAGAETNPLIALQVPAIHDLEPRFPVLVEAGEVRGGSFVASHRARKLLWFDLDRGLPELVRRILGIAPS